MPSHIQWNNLHHRNGEIAYCRMAIGQLITSAKQSLGSKATKIITIPPQTTLNSERKKWRHCDRVLTNKGFIFNAERLDDYNNKLKYGCAMALWQGADKQRKSFFFHQGNHSFNRFQTFRLEASDSRRLIWEVLLDSSLFKLLFSCFNVFTCSSSWSSRDISPLCWEFLTPSIRSKETHWRKLCME